jgi:AAA domain
MFKTLNTKTMDEPWTRWFLYGDTGTGKTTAASTFPRPLFLVPVSEKSVTVLAGRNVPYLLVRDWSSPFDQAHGIGGMNQILQTIEMEFKRDPNAFPYDTIVAEALTHLAELFKDELTQGSKISMDVQKYDKLTSYFRGVHARLSQLDTHVVYCALAQVDEKTEKGDAYLSKKIKEIIPSSCEVYGYLTATDKGKDKNGNPNPKEHKMYTTPHGQWKARTRFKRLPPVIKNFNFNDIKHLLVNIVDDEPAEVTPEPAVNESAEQLTEQQATQQAS